MSSLAETVRVNRRFQRSIRVDTDIDDAVALEGFVCPPSSAQALISMSRQVSETGQGAFTWTGPYGTGKSSMAVALAALLVEQDVVKAMVEADRVVCFQEGRLTLEGIPAVLTDQAIRHAYFGD